MTSKGNVETVEQDYQDIEPQNEIQFFAILEADLGKVLETKRSCRNLIKGIKPGILFGTFTKIRHKKKTENMNHKTRK